MRYLSGCCAARDLCRLVIFSTHCAGPSAAGMCMGAPWGGHCQGAHMVPVFGSGKQLSRRPQRMHALPREAAARLWQEFCWVLLNQGQGGGALYWKQHLSVETYYFALLPQGHCKSSLIFFFPQDCWQHKFVLPCTPLSVRDLKCFSHGVIRQSQRIFVAKAAGPCT